jgi:ABC-2 type transport system permease protein
VTYLGYELLRSFRNWRFLFFSLAYPLVLCVVVAGANRHADFNGIAFPVYFMAAMATLGAMSAAISSAAVIATERSTGWTRQLRITPLSPRAYLRAKVFSGYARAILTIALVSLPGIGYGVRLSAAEWGTVIGLLLVGIIPLAALGHLLGADSSMPAIVGIVTLFSLLGGVYGFQIAKSGVMFDIIKDLPSYWLVQAGDRSRRPRLASPGVDRDRRLDGRPHPARRARLPA